MTKISSQVITKTASWVIIDGNTCTSTYKELVNEASLKEVSHSQIMCSETKSETVNTQKNRQRLLKDWDPFIRTFQQSYFEL